jgi:hypothetical protein
MAFWAADPLTLRILALFGFPRPGTVQPKTAAPNYQRQPIARKPTVIANPSTIFGSVAEGYTGGDGVAVSSEGAGTGGISTEGLTVAGAVNIGANTVGQAMSIIGMAFTALAVPLGLVGKAVQYGAKTITTALARGTADQAFAEEGSPAAADLAAQTEAQAAFAAENPFTAAVLGFFGIHATAQPTAEELAAAEQEAHSLAVAASLGINDTSTQGFAFEGGYVDINGNALGQNNPDINLEVEDAAVTSTDAAAAAAAAAADAAAAASAAAAAADAAAGQADASAAADEGAAAAASDAASSDGPSDGGGGGGGTGGDGGDGGDGE